MFPWLTAFGNVMFGLKLDRTLSNAERRERAHRHLVLVGLDHFAAAHVHELSGGMRQRVALARALAPDPKVLLMDEPFAALDAMTRDQLYADLQEIFAKTQKTVISVTHNVREAACLADRVLLMSPRPGRIERSFIIDLPRPLYARAARTMGSEGFHKRTRVILPASLPFLVSGMKQGWAFAWRSLAAEIFVTILSGFGLGQILHYGRELNAMDQVVGVMLVIVVIGLVADRLLFAPWERFLHRRWGTDLAG